jgi:hypothetical protein
VVEVSPLVIVSESIANSSTVLIFIGVGKDSINKLVICKITEIGSTGAVDVKLTFAVYLAVFPSSDVSAYWAYVETLVAVALVIEPLALVVVVLGVVVVSAFAISLAVPPLAIVDEE